jgi:predicted trehalose synthase
MSRRYWLVLAAALTPSAALAQQDPVERLAEVLPESVRDQVIARVTEARARDLPEQAMANLALEGVAKGRSAEEVLAAVELLVADMGRAQEAIQAAGRPPVPGDIEAATAAMRMGVDGSAVSELARSGPSGRSLAVPLLVIGALAERGLPSDDALAVVRDRLEARADDAEILREFPDVAQGLGMRPEQVGTALASERAGFQVPVSGVTVPVGPPTDPGPGTGRPPEGRGRPDGVPQGGGPPS